MPYNPDGSYTLPQKFGTGTDPGNTFPPAVGADFDDIAAILNGLGAPDTKSLAQFGTLNDSFGDNTATFDNAFAWLNETSDAGRSLIIPPGNYGKTGTHTATQNGTSIIGYGTGRETVIAQLDDLDSIIMAPPNPATGINVGFAMKGIGIRRTCGTAADTGVDLKLIGQFQFVLTDICLFNAVNGLNIQGGDTGTITGLVITQNQDIVVRRVGSSLLKIESQLNGGAINSHCNTMFFSNFNISGLAASPLVDYAIQITGGDGIHFSNGHTGLAGQACCLVKPSTIAGDYIVNHGFANVFFDGSGVASQAFAIQSGNAGQTVKNFRWNNCIIGGSTANGLVLDYPTINSVVTGNLISDNVTDGLILNGGAATTGATIVGNRFEANGTNITGTAVGNASTLITANNTV